MIEKIEPYKGIATIYDKIRPSYPEKLIQDIISRTKIDLSDKLLEIGAGTGKATIQFAEKGFSIHAIELGEDMAEILKVKCSEYPKVSLEVTSFEEWNSKKYEEFDLIYCAQAFHWLDTNIKYKKCHELLKDQGYLVLFWYNTDEYELEATKVIDEKVEELVRKYVADDFIDSGKPKRRVHLGASNIDERESEIKDSGLFEMIEKIEYTQEIRNNAKKYLEVKKTVPTFATILDGLDDEAIEKMENEIVDVINNHGGYVSTVFNFSLYIAKKII